MQTFLPYADFRQCAQVLDRQRLGKQRVECKQILLALTEPTYGWKHHPAVKMWRGHEHALAAYAWVMCDEWRRRGYNDSLQDWFVQFHDRPWTLPAWIGDERVHESHRSALARKLPDHYAQFGWAVTTPDYYWPVQ